MNVRISLDPKAAVGRLVAGASKPTDKVAVIEDSHLVGDNFETRSQATLSPQGHNHSFHLQSRGGPTCPVRHHRAQPRDLPHFPWQHSTMNELGKPRGHKKRNKIAPQRLADQPRVAEPPNSKGADSARNHNPLPSRLRCDRPPAPCLSPRKPEINPHKTEHNKHYRTHKRRGF